jgi:hypothetical protein
MPNLQGPNTAQAAIQTQESARDARQALTHFVYFTVLVRESEKADQGAKLDIRIAQGRLRMTSLLWRVKDTPN